jgi:hypothetical protein
MGRPKGSANRDTEDQFYDIFSRWPAAQREEALRTLERVNRSITQNERSRMPADKPAASALLESIYRPSSD